MVKERTGHLPSHAEAKQAKFVMLHSYDCLLSLVEETVCIAVCVP